MKRVGPLLILMFVAAQPALGYPEFEVWIEKNSGRFVDCAMCHSHAEGPEGVKAGQIRSLSAEELERLNEARSAFEPGVLIDNPVLNPFGDRIIERLGKKKVLEIRTTGPEQLVELYGMDSDLDGDGLPDMREYMEGTSPVDSRSGNPASLFAVNLQRHWFDILMTILATIAGLYGLNQFLRWFEHEGTPAAKPEVTPTDSTLGYLGRKAAGKRQRRG
jgi:hypothetical protein